MGEKRFMKVMTQTDQPPSPSVTILRRIVTKLRLTVTMLRVKNGAMLGHVDMLRL